nr:MAG TPA: hypothetical protein [Caudoviricetes sp.]
MRAYAMSSALGEELVSTSSNLYLVILFLR